MNLKKTSKRIAAPLAAAGLLSAAAVALAAGPAAASSIQNGYLQICAQGDYSAFINVLPVQLANGGTTLGYTSQLVPPGQCWWGPVDTDDQWAQVDVVGVYDSGQQFYIGSEWYNGDVSGMGIGAEGDSSSPWIETW